MNTTAPPAWAGWLLAAMLPLRDREAVTGDLLEEYREVIEPQRGKTGADRWYVRQVFQIALRAHLVWALLFAAIFVARAALDTLVPTHDFGLRSAVTTSGAMTVWVTAGFVLTWRTTLLRSAAIGGAFAAILACIVNYPIAAALIGIVTVTDNQVAWAGIQSSGGVSEMFVMPAVVLMPATFIASVGGGAALLVRRIRAEFAGS